MVFRVTTDVRSAGHQCAPVALGLWLNDPWLTGFPFGGRVAMPNSAMPLLFDD